MQNIKNIELLPQFFADLKTQYGRIDLKNEKLIVALLSDYIPGATDLKRCLRFLYESKAMECIIAISQNMNDVSLLRNKAVASLVEYSLMDQSLASNSIDNFIVALYPELEWEISDVDSNEACTNKDAVQEIIDRLLEDTLENAEGILKGENEDVKDDYSSIGVDDLPSILISSLIKAFPKLRERLKGNKFVPHSDMSYSQVMKVNHLIVELEQVIREYLTIYELFGMTIPEEFQDD